MTFFEGKGIFFHIQQNEISLFINTFIIIYNTLETTKSDDLTFFIRSIVFLKHYII